MDADTTALLEKVDAHRLEARRHLDRAARARTVPQQEQRARHALQAIETARLAAGELVGVVAAVELDEQRIDLDHLRAQVRGHLPRSTGPRP